MLEFPWRIGLSDKRRILIFFDTEFVGLGTSQIELVSIGMVAESSDSTTFYAEAEHDEDLADEFVETVVYPLLTGNAEKVEVVAEKLKAWVASLRWTGSEEVVFCCDSECDERLLIDAFVGRLPQGWRIENVASITNAFEYRRPSGSNAANEHHALYDAQVLRSRYLNGIGTI